MVLFTSGKDVVTLQLQRSQRPSVRTKTTVGLCFELTQDVLYHAIDRVLVYIKIHHIQSDKHVATAYSTVHAATMGTFCNHPAEN